MKKITLVIACLFVFATGALAVGPSSPVSFYAGGLVSVPSSPDPFKDDYKTGYHGLAGLGFKAAPSLQFIGKLEYHTFSSAASGVLGVTDGARSVIMYGADARFAPSIPAMPVKPFGFVGIGYANVKQEPFSGASILASALNVDIPSESQTKFYFNVGAGMELLSTPAFSFWLQARYVSVATEGEATQFIPISVGLRFF
jgi:opacity protein-like surface antigen